MNMNLGILALIGIIIVVTGGILVTSDLLPGISKEKQNQEPTELTSSDEGEGVTTEEAADETASNENDENETEDIVIFAKSSGGGGSSYTSSSSSSSSTTPAPTPSPVPVLTADAGGPYTGIVNESIEFNGSASSDPAENITDYTWDFGDGDTDSGMVVNHSYDEAREYTVTLNVTNSTGDVATNTTTANISEKPNESPVANAGGPYTAKVNDVIPFDGSNSFDPAGNITNYTWDFGNNVLEYGVEVDHTYDVAGEYEVTLTVTNYTGDTDNDIASVIVIVNPAPVAEAGNDQTVILGDFVILDGSASTDDEAIESYSWDLGDGNSSTDIIVTYEYSANGTYTATLTVTDEDGASDTDTVTITVIEESEVNIPPVADAGPDRSVSVYDPVKFNASNSTDVNGEILIYHWKFGDGTESNKIDPIHNYSLPGTYTVVLTVVDVDGAIDKDIALVYVDSLVINETIAWNAISGLWEGTAITGVYTYNEPFSGETNVGGKVIYGYGWTAPSAGLYRVTFNLNDESMAYFDANTVVYYAPEDEGDVVEDESDIIVPESFIDFGILTGNGEQPDETTGNMLSYPVIYSEDPKDQFGTFGEESFEGVWWWNWGYVIPGVISTDSKFNEPLSCLPGEGNTPNHPETATCKINDISPTITGESTPGVYSGTPSNAVIMDVQAVFLQKDKDNTWQAQSKENTEDNQIIVTDVDFGDNIEVVTWNTNNPIRLEVGLFQNRSENSMMGYRMRHVRLHGPTEVWGSTGDTYTTSMPMVYSTNAYLVIQRLADDFEIIQPNPDSENAPVGGVGVIVSEHNLAYIDIEIK